MSCQTVSDLVTATGLEPTTTWFKLKLSKILVISLEIRI